MTTYLNSHISGLLEASYGGEIVVNHDFSAADAISMTMATCFPIDRTVPALALSYPVSIAPTTTGLWTIFQASTGVELVLMQPGGTTQTIRCSFMMFAGEVTSIALNNPNNIDVPFRISVVGN